ncbi:hypothetical protein LTSEMON_5343 [Salmonella enterica subsp. enterica serovar Montevideo str. S5-403]|uniref:Uncharacterized protein n=1 Tax=Salmonella enterica subsp. enterica serovar Montevideo str. S5-403 TaxID=913242 RepID=G5QA56_SALMO|nr:hypothetical protein LTSEMON_5343 [Salmonella enterica subsp. enterica serovar Montevideo str. S5-403]
MLKSLIAGAIILSGMGAYNIAGAISVFKLMTVIRCRFWITLLSSF